MSDFFVLPDSIPGNEVEKRKLLDEMKYRAKGRIATKNYPDAIKLYTTAIEMGLEKSILYANRSMCHLNIGSVEEALNDANAAIKEDPSYVKGYYRKGMSHLALKQYDFAEKAFQHGLALTPNDKDFSTQIEKIQALKLNSIDEKIQLPSRILKTKTESSDNHNNFDSSSKSQPSVPNIFGKLVPSALALPEGWKEYEHEGKAYYYNIHTKESTWTRPKMPSEINDHNDDNDDNKDLLKGFKITSDGKKTAYFTIDLDEKTKALLGDNTPKRIDTAAIPTPTTSTSTSNTISGDNNTNNNTDTNISISTPITTTAAAATTTIATPAPATTASSSTTTLTSFWEDKQCTPWATERIRVLLSDVCAEEDDLTLLIMDIRDLQGEAQIMLLRGRKRHIYDYKAEVSWTLQHNNRWNPYKAKDIVVASGILNIMEITADEDYVFKITVNNNGVGGGRDLSKYIDSHVRSDKRGLQLAIKKAMGVFKEEFCSK